MVLDSCVSPAHRISPQGTFSPLPAPCVVPWDSTFRFSNGMVSFTNIGISCPEHRKLRKKYIGETQAGCWFAWGPGQGLCNTPNCYKASLDHPSKYPSIHQQSHQGAQSPAFQDLCALLALLVFIFSMFSKRSFRSRGLLGASHDVCRVNGYTVGGLVEWVWRGWGWWNWGGGREQHQTTIIALALPWFLAVGTGSGQLPLFGLLVLTMFLHLLREDAKDQSGKSSTHPEHLNTEPTSSQPHQVSIAVPCHQRPRQRGWDQRSAGICWRPATLPWSPARAGTCWDLANAASCHNIAGSVPWFSIPSVHFALPRRTAVNSCSWHVTPYLWSSISTPIKSLSLKSTANHGISAKSLNCHSCSSLPSPVVKINSKPSIFHSSRKLAGCKAILAGPSLSQAAKLGCCCSPTGASCGQTSLIIHQVSAV